MSRLSWAGAAALDEEQAPLERAKPLVVSLHFMRTALRRRLLVCVLAPILGVLAAAGYLVAFPPSHAAKASLVLTYDAQQDSTRAMETNLSLLKTDTLADRTTRELGLTMAPEDFLETLTVEQIGSEILSLNIKAPNDAEAVRRLNALTKVYLEFRAQQLSYQTQVVVDGLQDRIDKLKVTVRELNVRIDELTDAKNTNKLTDRIAQRDTIQSRINALEQSLEDATLRNSAVIQSSRLLDPPAPEPGRAKKSTALGLASGLIGGTALGYGTVLFLAITSNKLRRRSDIATVLGVDVKVSVGRTTPVRRAWRWLPVLHGIDVRRTNERQRLAYVISEELMRPTGRSSLAVAGIDNAGELGYAVAAAGRDLARLGYSITIVDLTTRGSRGVRALSRDKSDSLPTVLRARGVPALTHGVKDLVAAGLWEDGENTPTPELGDITLVLAELEPGIGAEHLASWTDRAVLVLTAGRSSVEKTRTIGDQIRAAGLDLEFAALLRSERTDHSGGSAPREVPVASQPVEELEPAEPLPRAEAR